MRKRLVLVVEDEAVVREVVAALLPDEPDLTAAVVRTAEKAVQAIAEMHPDLVLLDLTVPELDGIGLVRRLRNDPQTADLPLVALTAARAASRLPSLEERCDAVVATAADREGLLGALRRGDVVPGEAARPAPRSPTEAERDRCIAAMSVQRRRLVEQSARLRRRALEAREARQAFRQRYSTRGPGWTRRTGS